MTTCSIASIIPLILLLHLITSTCKINSFQWLTLIDIATFMWPRCIKEVPGSQIQEKMYLKGKIYAEYSLPEHSVVFPHIIALPNHTI